MLADREVVLCLQACSTTTIILGLGWQSHMQRIGFQRGSPTYCTRSSSQRTRTCRRLIAKLHGLRTPLLSGGRNARLCMLGGRSVSAPVYALSRVSVLKMALSLSQACWTFQGDLCGHVDVDLAWPGVLNCRMLFDWIAALMEHLLSLLKGRAIAVPHVG